jgi:hypothetical protein
MIQGIGCFIRKWGSILGVLLGCMLIIASIILQLMKVEYYEYYDLRHNQSVIRVPVFINYFLGVLLILINLKREWITRFREKLKK